MAGWARRRGAEGARWPENEGWRLGRGENMGDMREATGDLNEKDAHE
jgi:hypothetical protein